MHEQRPPTSSGNHPQGQPQQPPRVMPVQPHAPHHPHPVNVPHAAAQHAPRPVAAAATAPVPVDEDLVLLEEAIALEDDAATTPPARVPVPGAPAAHNAAAAASAPAPKKITFNADALGRQRTFKRKPHSTGDGACRVKTFHGKLSDQGLEYLDDAINVFLDEHPEIDVKFVQSNVGMFDGKFKDFALVVNVWY